jgi:hypothetical protein
MSITSDKLRLLEDKEARQDSFFISHEEDADLPPTELSGDENGEQSVFSQVDSANKSSTPSPIQISYSLSQLSSRLSLGPASSDCPLPSASVDGCLHLSSSWQPPSCLNSALFYYYGPKISQDIATSRLSYITSIRISSVRD